MGGADATGARLRRPVAQLLEERQRPADLVGGGGRAARAEQRLGEEQADVGLDVLVAQPHRGGRAVLQQRDRGPELAAGGVRAASSSSADVSARGIRSDKLVRL